MSQAGDSTRSPLAIEVASLPWAFTQSHPLDTADFIRQAKQRGFDLSLSTLRELYRRDLLVPFVGVGHRKVRPPAKPANPEPERTGTRLSQLRWARDTGRLKDLDNTPFPARLRFEAKPSDPFGWWNGLLYSRYQLTTLPSLTSLLGQRQRSFRNGKIAERIPAPHWVTLQETARLRRIAVVTTALEARYLPALDPEWLHLVNVEPAEWEAYRTTFDPKEISRQLGYPPDVLRQDAEWLLIRAHSLDPMGSSWGRLIRRTPSRKWEDLKGAVRSAMDYREVAEILLRFYEDLADLGAADPLPVITGYGWHPLDERLSARRNTLDEDLTLLGLSPHPRVVLAVEGDTEMVHVPLIWKSLGYPDAPELMRTLRLGGVDRDLQKVAAVTVTPLVGEKVRDFWTLIKPPTRLVIAVDGEGAQFGTSERIARTKTKILQEVASVLKGQGVVADNDELEQLVEIRTWPGGLCYELAHFDDDELLAAIKVVHQTRDGKTDAEVRDAIHKCREQKRDIKSVWSRWSYDVSKVELGQALWPAMERKIERCRREADAPVPPIVSVIVDSYRVAQRWRYSSFALRSATASTD